MIRSKLISQGLSSGRKLRVKFETLFNELDIICSETGTQEFHVKGIENGFNILDPITKLDDNSPVDVSSVYPGNIFKVTSMCIGEFASGLIEVGYINIPSLQESESLVEEIHQGNKTIFKIKK